MKVIFLFILFISGFQRVHAQQKYSDSLKQAFQSAATDSTKIFTLCKLSDYYSFLYPDSAMYYADKIIELSKKQNYNYGEALGLGCKGQAFDRVGDYPSALQTAYNVLEIAKTLDAHKLYITGRAYNFIGHLNHMTGNPKGAVDFFHKSISLISLSGEHPEDIYYANFQLAFEMLNLEKNDSALFYVHKGKEFLPVIKKTYRQPTPWLITANIYNALGKIDSAGKYAREGLKVSEENNSLFVSSVLYQTLASIFINQKKTDSSIYYLKKALSLSQKYRYKLFEIESSSFLSNIYDYLKKNDSTLKYLQIMLAAKEEVFGESRMREFQLKSFEDEKKQQELKNAKDRYQTQVRTYALLAALVVFLIIAFIFWRNNKQKQQANILLNEQKEKAESALAELKTTQAQLVQSEKMASLGELTAGIAHEIQNPLNFVNNFSEVNTELIEEMKTELEAGHKEEAIAIANDIKDNEQKINMHGKRADSIVKGMLQHSRSSTVEKELTDINTLADECMRLSWHGFRSKEKSINITLQTDFDRKIEKINIISQDVGRVLLNLFNNAFYSVAEKKKQHPESYEPVVSVGTKRMANHVEIKIRDNGNGIPQPVMDKIFNPFFTTKPTGQGTGLGLSLSYDIITKGHAGELRAVTTEGEFAEFIIILPAPYDPPPVANIHLS